MYSLAVFINSFPYPNIEVGAVVTGIVVVGIIAYRGGDSKLSSRVS